MQNLSKNWTARISWEYTGTNTGAGAGATSATPIYLGLMAIAGSILLKKEVKNKLLTPVFDTSFIHQLKKRS